MVPFSKEGLMFEVPRTVITVHLLRVRQHLMNFSRKTNTLNSCNTHVR